ncbi:YcxB family protein [Robertmurraya kyonggiensis]|uniref:YcxB family protein n=1 Tax=Robertmurraya kyonggiensis TaxID=1037680 RepID=A0A4U1D6E4_9BACI|nr:YcxB family protein [Robertmurraya kyonggiensis]TKC18034.1 YcxB family protein [Robertmurraya kyonggiensis]
MQIKYSLTEEDYLNFNLFHMKNSKTANKALKVQRYLIPIVYMVVAYVFARVLDGSYILSFSIFGIMGILWIIFYPKYHYNFVLRQVRKMITEGNNEGLLGEHLMTISEEGVHDANPQGETKVSWSGIQDLKEDEHYLYLYNSAVSAYILPKREVHDLAELRTTLNSKIK